MGIFRRRREEDDVPQESAALDHLEEYLPSEDPAPTPEPVAPAPAEEPVIRGRGVRATRGPIPQPPERGDDEVRSLEERLLASLRPGPEPAAAAAPTARAPEPAPAPAPTLLKDRPARPNPGMDIHRAIRRAITRALAEDLGDQGDISASATILPGTRATADLVAREPGVVAGLELVTETYALLDPRVTVELEVEDGDRVDAGTRLATISGPLRSILTGERVSLNFLGHLSGVATATARYVDAVAGTRAVIRDTRKTTPGLRLLEKMAVVAGGGVNHRLGLFDAILVKDNHNLGAGGVAAATRRALARANGRPVQVEVTSLEEMDAAVGAGATDILLDNFDLDTMRIAVERAPAEVTLEASGGVTLDNVAAVAATGVSRIAVGAITHSAPRLDVALDVTVVSADPAPLLATAAQANGLADAVAEEDLVDELADFRPHDAEAAPDVDDSPPMVDDTPPMDRHDALDPVANEPAATADPGIEDMIEDSVAFVEDAGFPADEEELDDDELFDVRPWSSDDEAADGGVVPLDAAPGGDADEGDLMGDLGLRGDTAVEDLARMDDDVPLPDDDVLDAFLDELERDEGTGELAADEDRD